MTQSAWASSSGKRCSWPGNLREMLNKIQLNALAEEALAAQRAGGCCHCEERSDEAIQSFSCGFWIASLRSQ
jgi:transcriptional regulator with GAF, ATPase, and Fis domain